MKPANLGRYSLPLFLQCKTVIAGGVCGGLGAWGQKHKEYGHDKSEFSTKTIFQAYMAQSKKTKLIPNNVVYTMMRGRFL